MLFSAAAADGAPELGRPGCLQGSLLSVMEPGPLGPREGAVSQSANHTLGTGGQDGHCEKEKVERGASWTQLTARFPFLLRRQLDTCLHTATPGLAGQRLACSWVPWGPYRQASAWVASPQPAPGALGVASTVNFSSVCKPLRKPASCCVLYVNKHSWHSRFSLKRKHQ